MDSMLGKLDTMKAKIHIMGYGKDIKDDEIKDLLQVCKY